MDPAAHCKYSEHYGSYAISSVDALFWQSAVSSRYLSGVENLRQNLFICILGYCGHQFGYFSGQLGDGKSCVSGFSNSGLHASVRLGATM